MTNVERARELRKAALEAADSNPTLAQELHAESQRVFEQPEPTGAMGLPFTEAGEVVQALAAVIVYREEHTEEEVREALRRWGPVNEADYWDRLGREVDALTEELFG